MSRESGGNSISTVHQLIFFCRQLAVVKGLVINKLQKISRGRSVLRSRCCRASYGIVCDTPWKKYLHTDQIRVKNPYDRKYYATNQIHWLVRQVRSVTWSNAWPWLADANADHRAKNCPRMIQLSILSFDALNLHKSEDLGLIKSPARNCRPTASPCVQVDFSLNLLDKCCWWLAWIDPQYIHCTIESDLTHIPLNEFRKENFHFWSRGRRCYRANYKVRVIIDPAHIRFELWYNETNYTKDRPIVVEWGEAAMDTAESPAPYAQ